MNFYGHDFEGRLAVTQAGKLRQTVFTGRLPIMGTGANMLSPFKAKMAMAVRSKNPHWRMHDIQRRHWLAMGAEHGVVTPDGRGAEFVVDDLVTRTPDVVRKVRALLPQAFPQALADSILNGLLGAAGKLARTA